MPTQPIAAIDVHAHFGIATTGACELTNRLMTGEAATVVQRAQLANTQTTVVSPLRALCPRGAADVVGGNLEAQRAVSETEGLLQWVVVDPLKPATYGQASERLCEPKCVGLKIHPEEHVYPIKEHGAALFEFAAEHGAMLLTHSGEPNSLPEDIVPFANEFPEVTLILAHLGWGGDGVPTHQVPTIQACAHGNVYVDTSSARNVVSGLIEWAVAEVGADRLLYGTDSPLYFAPMQRARIEHAEIAEEDKRKILHDNAAKLLNRRAVLPARSPTIHGMAGKLPCHSHRNRSCGPGCTTSNENARARS